MTHRFWIKLPLAILDDPNLGPLTGEQWRLAISLYVLAGRVDQDGALPDVDHIAWSLRLSRKQVKEGLRILAGIGFVREYAPGRWALPRFMEEQSPLSGAERTRQYRQRRKDVTNRYDLSDEEAAVVADSASTAATTSPSSIYLDF